MKQHDGITTPASLHDLSDIRLIDLPRHVQDGGELVVAEGNTGVPFAIARMFTVRAPLDTERGKHAHRLCSQLMICVSGLIDVVCDDGRNRRTFTLDRSNLALLVPPTIWNTVIYRQAASVLAVLCDRPYEEHDYIREYSAFTAMRTAARS